MMLRMTCIFTYIENADMVYAYAYCDRGVAIVAAEFRSKCRKVFICIFNILRDCDKHFNRRQQIKLSEHVNQDVDE